LRRIDSPPQFAETRINTGAMLALVKFIRLGINWLFNDR